MAETDIFHEFRREQGFSCSVFGPEHSHMLQDTGGWEIQYEILHNVARHFTQNMSYTVLIRDKWW